MAKGGHVWIGDIWIDVSIREQHGAGAEVTEHPVELGAAIADHIRPLARTISIEGLVTNHPIEQPLSHAGGARVDSSPLALEAAVNPLPRVPPATIQIEGEPSVGPLGIIPGVDQGVAILGALKIDVRSKRQFAAEHHDVNPIATTTYSATALRFTEPFDRVGAVHQELLSIVETPRLVTIVTGLQIFDSVALTDLTVERGGGAGIDVLKFSATGKVLRVVRSETVKLPVPAEPRGKPAQSKGKQRTEETKPAALSPAAQEQVSATAKLRDLAASVLGL